MADFVAVLKKTLDGMGDPNTETRERVYERARSTVMAKLDALSPPPPQAVADRQIRALEDAIAVIERDYAQPAKKLDPLDELEDVFASLNGLKDRATIPPPRSYSPPPTQRPTPAIEKAPAAVVPLSRATPQPAKPLSTDRNGAPADNEAAATDNDFSPAQAGNDDAEFPAVSGDDHEQEDAPARRGGYGRALAALLVVAALGGGAYGVWLNKDDFSRLVGLTPPEGTTSQPLQPEPSPPPADVAAAEPAEPPAEPESATPAATPAAVKLTQRLNEDGSEIDPGPATGTPALGEGTSVAEVTPPASTDAAPAETPPPATDATPPATEATPPAAEAPPVLPPVSAETQPPAAAVPPTADAPAAATPADPAAAAPAQPATPETPAATPPTDTAAAEQPAVTPPPAATEAPTATEPPAATAAADPAPVDPAAPAAAPPAAATPAAPTATAAAPQAGAAQPSVPVGQKAIFYEERTSAAQGSAEPGSTVWSVVQESPGGDRPAEPAIRAEATIPGKDIQLRLTIRRNADPTLPASHIVEMIFLTPDNFDGGGVDNVLRMAMKSSEQDAGNPLIGIPAKIADGFFLIAMNDNKAEMDANMNLLLRQSWIDIPIVYKSGRRALITMEKGIPGEKVFDDALKAWGVSTSG